ncbi:MAG: site-specific integrase [Bacteroidota bacterium]
MRTGKINIKFYPVIQRMKKGNYPLYCRISMNRKKTEFFTGQYVHPKNWDDKRERSKGIPELNGLLANIESNIRKIHYEKALKNEPLNARELKDIYFGKDRKELKLLHYFDVFISEISQLPDQYSKGTVKKYRTIQTHLKSYLTGIGKEEVLLNEFDLTRVSEFEFYLSSRAKLLTNTTTKYLKQVKALFNRAIQFGHLKKNPFEGHKFKFQKTNRTFLSKEEIAKIENLEIENESIQRVRDCFLFSVYTGLRYSDVHSLRRKNMKVDSGGTYWLEFSIIKTRENIKLPLLDKAAFIVDKYKTEAEITGRLLPSISNQKLNSYLKVIADLTDLNKNLTYHVARHTFATTITLSNNIPLEVVSKLLGHSNLSSTQIYARITNEYLAKTTNNLNQIL